MAPRAARAAALLLLLALAASACCYLGDGEPRPVEPVYAPIWQPRLSLEAKAAAYQASLAAHNRRPDGVVDYRRPKEGRKPGEPRDGWHADGPFFAGIHLGAMSLRYAATPTADALADVSQALAGLELLEAVTGKPGLFARYAAREPAPFDPAALKEGRRAAPPHEDYVWRGDVSKDQYAGAIFGVGACLAHVRDPGVRARAVALARRVAGMLEATEERIVDVDGEETTFGDLDPFYGPVAIALHCAIALGWARAAAEDGGSDAYYRALVERGFARGVEKGVFNTSVFTIRNYVNDNQAFLSLYPLLQLERDPELRARYGRGLERAWEPISGDDMAFYDAVYAACGGAERERAARRAIAALRLFPDEKINLPVDWTRREDLDLGRRFLNNRKCIPRAERPLPVNMRKLSTMMWVEDPYALAGNERARGGDWLTGLDYLQTYWMLRAHGFIAGGE